MQKAARESVDRAVTQVECPACGGTRLAPHALESRINGKNIAELCAMEVADLAEWFESVDTPSVTPLVSSIREALANFTAIGLGYRPAPHRHRAPSGPVQPACRRGLYRHRR